MTFFLCNCSAVKISWHLRNLRAILYEISRISKVHTLETMGAVVNGHSGDSVIDEMRCILCDGRIIYKGPPDICIEDSYRQHLCKSNVYKPSLTLAQPYPYKLISTLVQTSFFLFSARVHDITSNRNMSNREWMDQFVQFTLDCGNDCYPYEGFKLTMSPRTKGIINI